MLGAVAVNKNNGRTNIQTHTHKPTTITLGCACAQARVNKPYHKAIILLVDTCTSWSILITILLYMYDVGAWCTFYLTEPRVRHVNHKRYDIVQMACMMLPYMGISQPNETVRNNVPRLLWSSDSNSFGSSLLTPGS